MTALKHSRAVGDTLSEFAIQLTNGENPYDLTGFTVEFVMYDSNGAIVVGPTAVGITIDDADQGEVSYDFAAGAVATAGTFYGFFLVKDGVNQIDTFPPDDDGVEITVFDPAVRPPEPSDTIDILAAANTPQRVRTVEGTVEERPLKDLIAADQYQQSKNASDAVPWGIRIAKTKPPSIVGSILLLLGFWLAEMSWPGYPAIRYRWYDDCGRKTIWVIESANPPKYHLRYYQRPDSMPPGTRNNL